MTQLIRVFFNMFLTFMMFQLCTISNAFFMTQLIRVFLRRNEENVVGFEPGTSRSSDQHLTPTPRGHYGMEGDYFTLYVICEVFTDAHF
jgi:hypothetical protein